MRKLPIVAAGVGIVLIVGAGFAKWPVADRLVKLPGDTDVTVAPTDEWLARGVVKGEEGWRLAQDPRTFGVAGAPFDSLATGARAHVILARGERDPMVSTRELRAHASEVVEIAGCGHNAQVEKPDAIVDLLQRVAG